MMDIFPEHAKNGVNAKASELYFKNAFPIICYRNVYENEVLVNIY